MAILDANIKNNLFRQAGSVGANIGSAKAIQAIKQGLFDRLGENNLISARGFLGSQTATLLRRLLFTRDGAHGHYDPVWKLGFYTVVDPNTGEVGSKLKTVADDFAGADAPKYKFNYTVSLTYRNTLQDAITNVGGNVSSSSGSDLMEAVEFALKTASRPNPTVNYQDINFYNYRTKVGTKVDYGTMTIVFYDDNKNRAHNIYEAYLKSLSPIANVVDQYIGFAGQAIAPQTGLGDMSSIGALANGDEAGLISSIVLTHHLPIDYSQYRNSANNNTESAFTQVSQLKAPIVQYQYMNPKIVNMTLDDLDMSANDVTTVTLTFSYDSVAIKKAVNAFSLGNALNELGEIRPTGSRIPTTGFLSSLNSTLQQRVDSLNNSTLLNKVKNLIV
jgi:hypothetical protein